MNKEQQRFHAAVAAMQGILASERQDFYHADADSLAVTATKYGDALLAELDRTAPKDEPKPNDDGWHRHIPGDTMPDIKSERIEIMTRDGSLNSGNPKYFDFGISFGDDSDEIVAWRAVE
jgi:hypothetical protein